MPFRQLLAVWTILGWGWFLYDTIAQPTNLYNFTTWTWLLQTLFYTLFLLAKDVDTLVFLDAYMLPLVWTCEFSAALAVVYMMVAEAGMLQDSLDTIGPVLTWIGSFVIHYMTVVVLLVYMHHDLRRVQTAFKLANDIAPGRIIVLFLTTFALIYAYAGFFPPASHYGIAGMTDTVALLLLLLVAASGLLVFRQWSG